MSNSKAIDLNLKAIVVNSFNFEDSPELGAENKTFAEQAKLVLADFESQHNYPFNIKRIPNYTLRVADWLQGLPTKFTPPYWNGDILEHGIKSLHLKEDASEKLQEEYINNWFQVMANKLIKISEMKATAEKSLQDHIAKGC